MPSEHARLGPSAAERWLECPASVRMSAEVLGYSDSSYAREGTLAHMLAEIEARYSLGLMTLRFLTPKRKEKGSTWRSRKISEWLDECDKEGLTGEQIDDIKLHAKAYADLLVAKRDARPGTVVFLEERVFPGVPQCFGTGDAVLVSPDGTIEIVDFKYGSGVRVYVMNNPQLKLYGLGALEGYGDVVCDTERVVGTIYQPRVHEDPISHEWTPYELRDWRDHHVLPLAEEALSEDAHFNPGEVQCRWCPAAGICRPRAEAAIAEDFSTDPDILTDAELGELMDRMPEFRAWINAVEAVVFRKLYELRQHVPGWKVVQTEGRRSITDVDVATERLLAAGYKRAQVTRVQAKTLGDLEKLVGKAKLPEILGDVLKKGEGSQALVPETDPRPPIDSLAAAKADFEEEII